MKKGNTSFKPLKGNVFKLPSGIPRSRTGKDYSMLSWKNQTRLITPLHEDTEWNWTPQGLLSFCFLEPRGKKKAIENIHSSSRQASRKSKDHITFRCHKKPFRATAWLKGLPILFRGCHHSRKRRHGRLTPSQKSGQYHFGSSSTLPKLLPERRLDPPNHQGSTPSDHASQPHPTLSPPRPQASFPMIWHPQPHPPKPPFEHTP